jgi:hypothetical protein
MGQLAGQLVRQRAGQLANRFDFGFGGGGAGDEPLDLVALGAFELAQGVGREARVVGEVDGCIHEYLKVVGALRVP